MIMNYEENKSKKSYNKKNDKDKKKRSETIKETRLQS